MIYADSGKELSGITVEAYEMIGSSLQNNGGQRYEDQVP